MKPREHHSKNILRIVESIGLGIGLLASLSQPAFASSSGEFRTGLSCDFATCCPEGYDLVDLGTADDVHFSTAGQTCIVGGPGRDTISQYGDRVALLGGPGDDILMSGPGSDLVAGGAGRDTIYTYGGTDLVLAGPGDDVVFSGNGNSTVLPGPGVDNISTGLGDDTVVLLHACEAEAGEIISDAGGSNRLVSPLTRSELEQRGVSISGDFDVQLFESSDCYSECSGGPNCAQDEYCIEIEPGEATCVPTDPGLGDVDIETHDPFDGVDAPLKAQLEAFARAALSFDAGNDYEQRLNTLRRRRVQAASAVASEYQRTPQNLRFWRWFQADLLAQLNASSAIPDLVQIANEPIPEYPIQPGDDAVNLGGEEAMIRGAALRGLANLAERGFAAAEQHLLGTIGTSSGLVREQAALAYLSLGRTPERIDRVQQQLAGEDAYILDLEIFSNQFPQPPSPI